MNIKDTKITRIVPYNNDNDTHIINVIPVSKGCNYKKLCIMIFVTLFLIFLMITATISIVGIVSISYIVNKPIPTNYPTTSPTMIFYNTSNNYTSYPTSVPTYMPSKTPTYLPSLTPTFFPSISPTSMPSNKPTFSPSIFPTTTPSNIPTNVPSQNPTFIPSVSPSFTPSFTPSSAPSVHPTYIPSSSPLQRPDNDYSLYPTPLVTDCIHNNISQVPTIVPTRMYHVIYVYTNQTITTTLYTSDQFKILIDVLTIICPICLCCVCIHIPLVFVPICLKLRIDKVDLFEDSITQKIKVIQKAWRNRHTRKKYKT